MRHDRTPRRVSACPVHFLWDGIGGGRAFIRTGFLGFAAAGMASSASLWLRQDPLDAVAGVLWFTSGGLWAIGQIVSLRARWAMRTRP